MFIGVDHGTTAMRFVAIGNNLTEPLKLEVPRSNAASMDEEAIISLIESSFGVARSDIGMMAVTYSMGDSLTSFENLHSVENRGVRSIEGAGKKTGGGSRVFDAIRNSSIPAVLVPGIHDKSDTDPRLNVFSHSTSPEKLGIAYHALCKGIDDFILSDISSNTVTLAVSKGRLIGAIDACVFAPGLRHGPLDVQALRDVDAGRMSANDAFVNAGVLKHTQFSDRHELLEAAEQGDKDAILAFDTIALFAAMEIASMQILLKDYGSIGDVVLEGSIGEMPGVVEKINKHLDAQCHVLDRWSAAEGCAEIARDIATGHKEILGIPVNL
ncbi:methanogenesis marker 12 protein [Methanolobus sp. ZRKC3]|uniref:methanogenesis marker 12 protein n=1 Tax=Methanolobus sp. ZRKC3 TaxID=3125786 RepID=UPI003252D8FA